MRKIGFLVCICFGVLVNGQTKKVNVPNAIPTVVDSMYREDQVYLSLAFNLLNNQPDGFAQNGFSGGLQLGVIRDMPFNKRRNKSIGVGLGLARSIYNTNLFIGETINTTTTFNIIPENAPVDRNRLVTNLIEMPIQYRWRTSTATTHTFWRIHAGVKFGYIFSHVAKFDGDGLSIRNRNIPELDLFRYAATLTIGNGSFNGFVQYDLNPLFNANATINGQTLNLQPIKFGIEFYLL